jgi:hypothetical protein
MTDPSSRCSDGGEPDKRAFAGTFWSLSRLRCICSRISVGALLSRTMMACGEGPMRIADIQMRYDYNYWAAARI